MACVMKTSSIFFRCCRKVVGNGENTLLWEYLWIGDKPLRERYNRMYRLTFSFNLTVPKYFRMVWGVLGFRESYLGILLSCGLNLRICVPMWFFQRRKIVVGGC